MAEKYLTREIDLTENNVFGKPRNLPFFNDNVSISDSVTPDIRKMFGLRGGSTFIWNDEFRTLGSESDMKERKNEFDNELFNYIGFCFYGDIDNPLIMGIYRNRQGKKDLLEEEYGGYCYRCGKKLTVFDLGYNYCMCTKCEEREESRGFTFNSPDFSPLNGYSASNYFMDFEMRETSIGSIGFVDSDTLGWVGE